MRAEGRERLLDRLFVAYVRVDGVAPSPTTSARQPRWASPPSRRLSGTGCRLRSTQRTESRGTRPSGSTAMCWRCGTWRLSRAMWFPSWWRSERRNAGRACPESRWRPSSGWRRRGETRASRRSSPGPRWGSKTHTWLPGWCGSPRGTHPSCSARRHWAWLRDPGRRWRRVSWPPSGGPNGSVQTCSPPMH